LRYSNLGGTGLRCNP